MDEAFYGDMYNCYDAVMVSSEDVLEPVRKLAKKYHPKKADSINPVLCHEIVDKEENESRVSLVILLSGYVENDNKLGKEI